MGKLKILFSASEVVPFAKTGGLADVAGALPKALAALGHEVVVVMPRYYVINKDNLEKLPMPLGVPMGPMGTLWAGIYRTTLPNSDVSIYMIDYEQFFGRSGLYSDEHGFGYEDNDKRFVFLSKAALALCEAIDFWPDLIHANDWHTAAQPALVHTRFADRFHHAATLLTIHNLQHQGHFFKGVVDLLEIGWERFSPFAFESMGGINLLKGGIAEADAITTVSRRYAREIQTSEYGFGLDGHIRAHAHKLFGVLNGVDYDIWNPATDPWITCNYDLPDLSGKRACKADLQRHFGLEVRDDLPLIGFVGRFAEQKGIGLIAAALNDLLALPAQYVMLGAGEKWAEGFFLDVARRYPGRFGCYVGYDEGLSHRIEAGSDLFLMPSLFEPCGLNQIYSLRYGTPPIVRATGGLDDTIENYDPHHARGNGFKFYDATPEALYHTVLWAVETFKNDSQGYKKMQTRGMQACFDWDKAARAYEDIYHYALYAKRVGAYR